MLSPLVSLGIAETVFYVPITPVAIYVLYRNWHRKPMIAWYPFILLSLMRLAGGPVLIALANDMTSVGLFIAATFLLNIGVIPLLIVNFGLVQMVMMDNLSDKTRVSRFVKIVRISLGISITFLIAGSSSATSLPDLARIFQLVGYSVMAVILLGLFHLQVKFRRDRENLVAYSNTVPTGALAAAPFLIIRNVYGLLYYATNYYSIEDGNFVSHISIWNPILGSPVAFALMALLTEYVAICIYFYIGLTIPAHAGSPESSTRLGNGAQQIRNNPPLLDQRAT